MQPVTPSHPPQEPKKELPEEWPYIKKSVLTQVEQDFFQRLKEALPNRIVLAQVELSRVIAANVPKHEELSWFNRINGKSLDFVICKPDLSVIAAIELDDSSHNRPHRKKADTTKNKALADAGVPLVRFNVKTIPDTESIKKAIAHAMIKAAPKR